MSGDRIFTVFGGTGFLGSRVVGHLLDDGHRVRVAARNPRRKPELLQSAQAEPVRADLFEPATIAAAMEGAHGAVNATSLYLEKGDLTFHAVHVEAAARLARAAKDAGLSRFVQVSGIGSDAGARDSYIRARGEGERVVRAAFPTAIIVRPAVMFGPDDAFLKAILKAARRFPIYPLFGRGETRLQPVHVDDVARAICRALQLEEAALCYELAGPDVFTYRELVKAVAQAAGLRVRTIPIPFPLWRTLALVAERLPAAPLTRSQVALVEEDNVADNKIPGLHELGVSPTSIKDFVHRSQRAQ